MFDTPITQASILRISKFLFNQSVIYRKNIKQLISNIKILLSFKEEVKKRKVLQEKDINVKRKKLKNDEEIILQENQQEDQILEHESVQDIIDIDHEIISHDNHISQDFIQHDNLIDSTQIMKKENLEIKYKNLKLKKQESTFYIFKEIQNKIRNLEILPEIQEDVIENNQFDHQSFDQEMDDFQESIEYPRQESSILNIVDKSTNFNELTKNLSRIEQVEMFFDLLVNIDRGNCFVHQESCYGDIFITKMDMVV